MPDYRHSRQDHTVSHTWFTSDLHIGHKLVARHRSVDVNFFSPGRSREVSDEFVAAWHDGMLSENWDAHVGRDDIVWVLGDISAGGSNAQRNALQWITQRPGRKRLVSGNHDGCHPMHRNSHNWLREYLKAFESVQSAARIRINGHSVLLSHFPYRDDHTEVPRFDQWRLRNLGELLLHGHTHSAERVYVRAPNSDGKFLYPAELGTHAEYLARYERFARGVSTKDRPVLWSTPCPSIPVAA